MANLLPLQALKEFHILITFVVNTVSMSYNQVLDFLHKLILQFLQIVYVAHQRQPLLQFHLMIFTYCSITLDIFYPNNKSVTLRLY